MADQSFAPLCSEPPAIAPPEMTAAPEFVQTAGNAAAIAALPPAQPPAPPAAPPYSMPAAAEEQGPVLLNNGEALSSEGSDTAKLAAWGFAGGTEFLGQLPGVEEAWNAAPDDAYKKTLGGAGQGLAGAMTFLDHFMGDDPVSTSYAGHAIGSGVKTVADETIDGVFDAAAGGPASLIGDVNNQVDIDNPIKMFTQMGAELSNEQLKGAVSGGVDAATVAGNALMGDMAAAYQGADRVEDNAASAKYGTTAQALTWGTAMLTGDQEVLNTATDQKAETGERGIFAALGNCAGDSWADVAGNGGGGDGHFTDADAYQRELDDMAWYAPWTW